MARGTSRTTKPSPTSRRSRARCRATPVRPVACLDRRCNVARPELSATSSQTFVFPTRTTPLIARVIFGEGPASNPRRFSSHRHSAPKEHRQKIRKATSFISLDERTTWLATRGAARRLDPLDPLHLARASDVVYAEIHDDGAKETPATVLLGAVAWPNDRGISSRRFN